MSSKRTLSDLLNDEVATSQSPCTKPRLKSPSPESNTEIKLPYPSTSAPITKQTAFQQPTKLISFSYSPTHELEFNDSAMRYYVDPPLGAKLGYGYDRWIRRPDDRGRIDGLLQAVSRVRRDPMLSGALVGLGVVAWRGIITKILTAPYEDRDGWELNVMYVNGTMYFEEHATQEKLNEKNDMKPRQLLQTYYGYAFESYCTSETPSRQNILLTPDVPYGWNGDVNTNVQWCSVVRTKLGDTRIVIGGEVDCVRDSYTGKTDKFVELKTSMTIRNQNDEARFEKKLLKFYFQSFLLGVPEVVVGFRTPAGVVTTTQSFKTIQIPRMVRGKADAWDPLICLDWGHRFLTFLKETVEMGRQDRDMDREDSSRVWRVKFTPGSGISVRILGKTDVDEVVNGEDRVGFLPSWYWEEPRAFRESPGLARPTEVGGRGPQPPSAAGGTTNSSNSGTTSTAGWQI